MPSPVDRRGRLVGAEEFEAKKEQEREARLARFSRPGSAPSTREVQALGPEEHDWEPPPTRSHDPHTVEALRARYAERLNRWTVE